MGRFDEARWTNLLSFVEWKTLAACSRGLERWNNVAHDTQCYTGSVLAFRSVGLVPDVKDNVAHEVRRYARTSTSFVASGFVPDVGDLMCLSRHQGDTSLTFE